MVAQARLPVGSIRPCPGKSLTTNSTAEAFRSITVTDQSTWSAVATLDLAGCPLASSQDLPNNELTFTCNNAPSGLETRGVVLVHPDYQGWLRVQVTLTKNLDETASKILNSVH